MPKCIAAVFAAAWNLIRALLEALSVGLFSQPRGRHSAEQLRRRRSTRVRPYAPMTPAAPERLPSHPTVHGTSHPNDLPPLPEPPALKSSALKPPSVEFDADEDGIALVRPYFTAHEHRAEAEAKAEAEADRAQNRATARLRAWGADLDHLEFGPDTNFSFGPAPEGTRVYTLDDYRDPGTDPDQDPEPEPTAPADTFHVPAPRTPAPRVPARMNGLPHLSRIRARQQERRSPGQGQGRVLEGAGV